MAVAEIYLNVISPEKELLGRMVSSVTLPGSEGNFTVLRNHAPLMACLRPGRIEFVMGERKESIDINSGFVEVCDNKVTVCAEV